MGLFDELDIAGASDNPFEIPDNTYECVLSDLVVKKNSKDNMGMTFTYTIQGGDHDGLKITEYKRMPHSTDKDKMEGAEKDKALSYIKVRLASLDVPEARMNTIEKDDLVGTTCYVTTKQNGQYTNVRDVTTTLSGGAPAAGSGPRVDPFAQ